MTISTKYRFGICVFLLAAAVACEKQAGPAGKVSPAEETDYFAVFMEGKKVGHAVQTRAVADGKVTSSEKVRITVSRASIAVTVETKETSIETIDGKPVGFEVTQHLGAMTMKVTATVDEQGTANLTTTSMGTAAVTRSWCTACCGT